MEKLNLSLFYKLVSLCNLVQGDGETKKKHLVSVAMVFFLSFEAALSFFDVF